MKTGFFCVYIVQSESEPPHFYAGFTEDLPDRLAHHNSGGDPHTMTFGWLLRPAKGAVPEWVAQWIDMPDGTVQLKLEGADAYPLEIAIRLDDHAGQGARLSVTKRNATVPAGIRVDVNADDKGASACSTAAQPNRLALPVPRKRTGSDD